MGSFSSSSRWLEEPSASSLLNAYSEQGKGPGTSPASEKPCSFVAGLCSQPHPSLCSSFTIRKEEKDWWDPWGHSGFGRPCTTASSILSITLYSKYYPPVYQMCRHKPTNPEPSFPGQDKDLAFPELKFNREKENKHIKSFSRFYKF